MHEYAFGKKYLWPFFDHVLHDTPVHSMQLSEFSDTFSTIKKSLNHALYHVFVGLKLSVSRCKFTSHIKISLFYKGFSTFFYILNHVLTMFFVLFLYYSLTVFSHISHDNSCNISYFSLFLPDNMQENWIFYILSHIQIISLLILNQINSIEFIKIIILIPNPTSEIWNFYEYFLFSFINFFTYYVFYQTLFHSDP